MDLASVLGLAMSALGLGSDLVKTIKEKLAKKVLVTPNLVNTTSRHWDTTNSVIVQNNTNKPLFSLQIVFWHESNQKLEFRLEDIKKEARVENLIIDYGVVIFRGVVENEKIVILEILRLMPNECIEIDLQIKKQGSVKIFPVSYDENQSKKVLNNKKEFVYPFKPPFDMQLGSIGLYLKKSND